MVFLSGFLIDQPALCRAGHVSPFTVKHFVATGGFVHFIMQWRPVDGGESGITGSQGGVADVVIDLAGWLNVIAQFLQRLADQFCLKRLFADGALNGCHADAFTRQIGGECGGCCKCGEGGNCPDSCLFHKFLDFYNALFCCGGSFFDPAIEGRLMRLDPAINMLLDIF
ncbi:hypothetical protein SRABI106_04036 [Rahnella aquatilis]|nr:hypothetical protein SRABI106_04036 [Rahnella aquatilis]